MSDDDSCLIDATRPPLADGPPYAMGPPPERSREWGSVLCREPTEHPESYKGITLCPFCEWQEAQRTACSW
ncbi:hypothetical protein [Streptomyces sp. AK010]|uniref:hypothetical protein n=1 Tax=Streptomyces sp. AK010 TaxID=2723074 RepID=UPI0016218881|nr:hypothetical protein [Streptomyces sp. AK010]MBB6417366.1 hypothetical protein [Streptomyces sp. AK010]